MMSLLRSLKLGLVVLCQSISSLLDNYCLLLKGQSKEDSVLQMAHRIEKGLCISKPKDLWGWDKANILLQKCTQLESSFAKDTGLAVLAQFIKSKKNGSEGDRTRAEEFEIKYGMLLKDVDASKGGGLAIEKTNIVFNIDEIEKLFNSRHSIRDFDDSVVSRENLLKALLLANRCPSACNRQPTHVYVIPTDIWMKYTNDPNQVYNSSLHLLITTDRTAYTLEEINDWIVSGSIYAAYLSLTLTAYGIGSCVIKKNMLNDNHYKNLKEYCGIPKSEKIIIELAIGNLKESFKVPVSNRKATTDYIKFVN